VAWAIREVAPDYERIVDPANGARDVLGPLRVRQVKPKPKIHVVCCFVAQRAVDVPRSVSR
jgi:hypothetical protein